MVLWPVLASMVWLTLEFLMFKVVCNSCQMSAGDSPACLVGPGPAVVLGSQLDTCWYLRCRRMHVTFKLHHDDFSSIGAFCHNTRRWDCYTGCGCVCMSLSLPLKSSLLDVLFMCIGGWARRRIAPNKCYFTFMGTVQMPWAPSGDGWLVQEGTCSVYYTIWMIVALHGVLLGDIELPWLVPNRVALAGVGW